MNYKILTMADDTTIVLPPSGDATNIPLVIVDYHKWLAVAI